MLCLLMYVVCLFFFFFKQKTAYEMRISDWSSDVCSSDLPTRVLKPIIWRRPTHIRAIRHWKCSATGCGVKLREPRRIDVGDRPDLAGHRPADKRQGGQIGRAHV